MTIHVVAGYDKRTERLGLEFEVDPAQVAEVRELANVPVPAGEPLAGNHPIDPSRARSVIAKIRQHANVDLYDWFLEPYAS